MIIRPSNERTIVRLYKLDARFVRKEIFLVDGIVIYDAKALSNTLVIQKLTNLPDIKRWNNRDHVAAELQLLEDDAGSFVRLATAFGPDVGKDCFTGHCCRAAPRYDQSGPDARRVCRREACSGRPSQRPISHGPPWRDHMDYETALAHQRVPTKPTATKRE
ncbi:hypothetical protein M527_16040 [Sphingobium indicum IP26]|nr:hypothetical protein M527_16040 [Sphingobium indicum IP26]